MIKSIRHFKTKIPCSSRQRWPRLNKPPLSLASSNSFQNTTGLRIWATSSSNLNSWTQPRLQLAIGSSQSKSISIITRSRLCLFACNLQLLFGITSESRPSCPWIIITRFGGLHSKILLCWLAWNLPLRTSGRVCTLGSTCLWGDLEFGGRSWKSIERTSVTISTSLSSMKKKPTFQATSVVTPPKRRQN